jgi:DNA-directed RNA polymerase subunit H (RpoH/RPB5)
MIFFDLERYFYRYIINMDFEEKKNLFKVRKTILEMINDRGIHVPDIENITFEEFTIKYNNKNLDIYIENEIDNKKIYVHFHNEIKNFSKNDLKSLMQKLINEYEDEEINLILLLKEKENSAVTKELEKDVYKNVEIFLKKNMMFNITHHQYVPKHIILTKEEEDEFLEKYNTTRKKLPKMPSIDPVAKYYGMKVNQICKIIRISPEVGEYVYYRLVR